MGDATKISEVRLLGMSNNIAYCEGTSIRKEIYSGHGRLASPTLEKVASQTNYFHGSARRSLEDRSERVSHTADWHKRV